MSSKTRVISNVRVGKADVRPTTPTHVKGVRKANAKGNARESETEGPRRSTGVNPNGAAAMDPRMPKISPA